MKITAGKASALVTIWQKAAEALLVTKDTYEVSDQGGEIEVEVKSNVSYTLSIPAGSAEWISRVETKALTTTKERFQVAVSHSDEPREGQIIFLSGSSSGTNVTLSDTVRIFQSAAKVLLLSGDTLSVSKVAQQAKVQVRTNIEYQIDFPADAPWISLAPETKASRTDEITFALEANETINTRQAAVVFKDKNSDLSATLTVIQAGETPLTQREALEAIYRALDGDHWVNNENWCSDKPLNEWFGIEAYGDSVVNLILTSNNLSGEIPAEIGALTSVSALLLGENHITGTLPDQIGNLKSLEYLSLSGNQLLGTLPESLFGLQNLIELDVSRNLLEGEIPSAVGQLKNLKWLDLYVNYFSGTIPPELGEMTALHNLHLAHNLFTGPIPETLGNLTNLVRLDLWDNSLSGSIPAQLGQLTKLTYLAVSHNQLTGSIPAALGNLTNLTILGVQNNRLEGEIPAELGNLSRLDRLTLYNNELTGTIPESLAKLPLTTFSCDYNMLDVSDLSAFASNPHFASWTFSNQSPVPQGLYASTDFSRNGTITTLQQATKGNGINIVVMGDAFVDTDMGPGGFYETKMKQAMDAFLGIEPVKSFKDYFNFYSIDIVSTNNIVKKGSKTALHCQFEGGTALSGDIEACYQYAMTIPGITSRENLLIIVVINGTQPLLGGTCHFNRTVNSAVSLNHIPNEDNDTFVTTIRHESVGHGFGYLADEYSMGAGVIDDKLKAKYQYEQAQYGWWSNIDFTNDPEKIRWSFYLNDSRYKDEVGIYEGAFYYDQGIYRPSENSLMNNSQTLNAPSRETIYRRIKELAGETYRFEDFLEYDTIN